MHDKHGQKWRIEINIQKWLSNSLPLVESESREDGKWILNHCPGNLIPRKVEVSLTSPPFNLHLSQLISFIPCLFNNLYMELIQTWSPMYLFLFNLMQTNKALRLFAYAPFILLICENFTWERVVLNHENLVSAAEEPSMLHKYVLNGWSDFKIRPTPPFGFK